MRIWVVLVVACAVACMPSLSPQGAAIQRLYSASEAARCSSLGVVTVGTVPFHDADAHLVKLRNLAVEKGANALWFDPNQHDLSGIRATIYLCPTNAPSGPPTGGGAPAAGTSTPPSAGKT